MIAVNPDRTRCPYEVGDILQTLNSTPPAQRWPGTQWQQITDRFVRGADAQHPAGSVGGNWTHTQTLQELYKHYHRALIPNKNSEVDTLIESGGYFLPGTVGWASAPGEAVAADCTASTSYIPEAAYTGASQPMDITNPYYSAYIWLRTG